MILPATPAADSPKLALPPRQPAAPSTDCAGSFHSTLLRYDKPSRPQPSTKDDAQPTRAADTEDQAPVDTDQPVAQDDTDAPVATEEAGPDEVTVKDETETEESPDESLTAAALEAAIFAQPVEPVVPTAEAPVEAKPDASVAAAPAVVASATTTDAAKPEAPASIAAAQPSLVDKLTADATSAQPQQQQGDHPQHAQTKAPAPQPQAPAPQVSEVPTDKPHAQPAAPAPTAAAPGVVASATTTDVAKPDAPTPTTAQPAQQAADHANRAENDALNAARLARGLQSAVNQRGGAITLRLTPPDIGTVRVQMQITASRVTVQFHAETSQGQALLNSNLAQLRTTLEGQGLQVDRIGVQPMQPAAAGNSAHTSSQQQDSSSSQHDTRADDGRSRGSFDRRHDQPRDDRRQPNEFNFQQLFEQGKER